MSNTPSTLKTSNNTGVFIAQETDGQYPCTGASVQTLDLNGNNPQPFLTLSFLNVSGLSKSVSRNLKNIKHDTQFDHPKFDVHLHGKDNIVVGLPALFRLAQQRGWEDKVISRPVISEAMQDVLLDQFSDFLKRSEDMPSPDEF